MKIAYFTDSFYPTINGVTTTILLFANGLVEAGHEVLIVAPKHSERDLTGWNLDPRVQVFLLPSLDAKVYPDIRFGLPSNGVLKVINVFKPDVIHNCTPFTVGLVGLFIAKRYHIPLIASHMTNYTDEEALKSLGQFNNPISRMAVQGMTPLLTGFLNRHTFVLTPTVYAKQYLEDLGLIKPMFVVPSPVDVSACAKGKKNGLKLRQALGISQSLIFVSRLSAEKNIDALLNVFAYLNRLQPELKLVLVGDGIDRERLFSLASGLGVNKSVVWVGNMPHSQLINEGYYYLGDVFVTLSTMETQGLSTVEAMGCGLPVVGAKAVGTYEVVSEVGLLVNPDKPVLVAKGIEKLLQDKKKLQTMQAKSLERATDFSLEVCVSKLEVIYGKLAEMQTHDEEAEL